MTTTEIETRAKSAGLTLSGLMTLAGVHRATFWRWKTGRFAPRAASVDRIRGILVEWEKLTRDERKRP